MGGLVLTVPGGTWVYAGPVMLNAFASYYVPGGVGPDTPTVTVNEPRTTRIPATFYVAALWHIEWNAIGLPPPVPGVTRTAPVAPPTTDYLNLSNDRM